MNSPGAVRGLTMLWEPRRRGIDRLPLVQRVLAARGITGDENSRAFIEPSLRHFHDPSGIPGLDLAAERLLRAARDREPIVIYGDYDVDGVTATAILFHTLRAIAPDCVLTTYVPHRLEEGYGLNSEAIRELAGAGAKVIVSVDCGITAIEPAKVASGLGVDLIITDHHTPPATTPDLPEAYAVVHPRHPESAYPFGDLCGAGVAYKLAWRLTTLACGNPRVTEPLRQLLIEMLALAALGVIADVMPLLGENRVMARFGLPRIKHSSIPGLRALVEASGLAGDNIEADDVGFRLGPRLNACGRMGHAREAVELLTTATGARAAHIAEQLSRLNDQRRATERAILEQAKEMAQREGQLDPGSRSIVLAHPGWHAGVVGIVCSRMVEQFRRPTLLLCESEGICHGSGRSIDGFNLHGALRACAGPLLSFGGHDMAAGLKVRSADFARFRDEFAAYARGVITDEMMVERTAYDTEAGIHELGVESVMGLQRLAPFGRENPAVCLRLCGMRVAARPETFGQFNRHLSLKVCAGPSSVAGRQVRIVGWNWAEQRDRVSAGMSLDLLIEPKLSTWGGGARVEGVLVDLALPAL